jgi:hypothetical protein
LLLEPVGSPAILPRERVAHRGVIFGGDIGEVQDRA